MRLPLAMLLALAAAAPAHAQTTPVAPADGARFLRDAPIEFRMTADPAATAVGVLVTAPVGDEEFVVAETQARQEGGVWIAALASPEVVPDRPGAYRWRAIAETPSGRQTGPPSALQVVVPEEWHVQSAIPRRFGRRSSRRFLLSRTGLPEGLSRARFKQLAVRAGRRWGVRFGGWTARRANVADRRDVVGFVTRLPRRGELGFVRDFGIDRRVLDRDLSLLRGARWHFGDDYPDVRHFDLETVLIHELGHFAGNHGHDPDCAGSPMVERLAPGEWWRTSRDWWAADCDPTPI